MEKAAIAVWLALLPLAPAVAEEALFGPDGYRIAHYRGPVAEPPGGVRRISAEEVARLRHRALLIDVVPAEGGHRDPDGTWRLAVPRPSLPGAHWFPEAGRGAPPPEIAAWFARGVDRLARGDKRRIIITFCLADCWMSWNAALRLRRLGYTDVRWFAGGTDDWRDLGRPLVPATPEPE